MSDPDQGWKPSRRPQSTMAQAFSAALDSAFELDSDVPQLTQNIDSKRQQMMIQNRELEELQKQIREAEQRLKSRQSVALDHNSNQVVEEQREGEQGGEGAYQSNESNFSSTSPSDGADQHQYYHHNDEHNEEEEAAQQRRQGQA